MAKDSYKTVLLAIGIALALAAFTGFLVWQIAETIVPDVSDQKYIDCYEICGPERVYDAEKPAMDDCWMNCTRQANEFYKQQEEIRRERQKIFSIATLVIGVIAVFIGLGLKIGAISGGLIGGSLVIIIEGIIASLSLEEKWIRVLSLGILLIILIYLAVRKTGKK